MTAHSGCLLA